MNPAAQRAPQTKAAAVLAAPLAFDEGIVLTCDCCGESVLRQGPGEHVREMWLFSPCRGNRCRNCGWSCNGLMIPSSELA